MTVRARLIYEKRRGACFVPHVVLADLFSRAARRAGLRLCSTEGFSPHPKMSFGPELPAGVIALCEAVDIWLQEIPGEVPGEKNTLDTGERLVSMLNEQMPEGFHVKKCLFPTDGTLGKECRAAHYRIWPRNSCLTEKLAARAKSYFGGDTLLVETGADEKEALPWISLVLADPAKNGLGGWVKTLVSEGLAAGWQDLCLARIALGRWNGTQVEEL
ncbi:MAG: TIGR03936 family radical SAM-associated protein [Synergistaceae bacterium]|jgi:radical SAM-linked protein|nr:TIGR03936 family radical SAM-associated protein [Synergistaceae bacterium]